MQFRDLSKQYSVLKPQIDASINRVINSSRFISGPEVKELEERLAEYVGVKHCITCANGTDAISIALKTLGIGKGDAVFVPDFTFFSTGECPSDEGATPVFVDVDPRTYNIDPKKLEQAVIKVIDEGKYKAKAVIAVDLFGLPADYSSIYEICKKHDLLLLEDGAQGFGGEYKGKKACGFGDISTTSFFPAKPLGCYGDGGAIFTNNDEWATLIRSLCVHGKDTSNLSDPNAKYNNVRIGKNSRLDTIQAAILLAKFDAFHTFELESINKVASWYMEELKESDYIIPHINEGYFSSWAQFTIQVPEGSNRNKIQDKLKQVSIPSMIYYVKPMHMQEAFSNNSIIYYDCSVTEQLCNTVLSIPIDPYKTREEIAFISKELINAL